MKNQLEKTKKAKAIVKKTIAVATAVSTEVVISALEEKAKPLFTKLKKIERIDSQEDLDRAGQQTKLLKALKAEATAQKKSMTDGLEQSLKAIRAHFKPFENKVDAVDTEIKGLMEEYFDRQDKLLAKIEEDFSNGKIKKVDTYTSKIAEAQVSGSKDGAQRRQLWKLSITDESKIPRQYMVPNEKLIEAVLKDGKKVPGAELKKVNSVAI